MTREADGFDFDLACWFSGDSAALAATQDGQESPPPNDYYVRNTNDASRPLAVDAGVPVVWYPESGDPTSEASTTYADWLAQDRDIAAIPGIWVDVQDGAPVSIHEQWVP